MAEHQAMNVQCFVKKDFQSVFTGKNNRSHPILFPEGPAKNYSGSNSPDTRRPASSAGPHSIRLFPRSLMFHLRFYSQRNPLEK